MKPEYIKKENIFVLLPKRSIKTKNETEKLSAGTIIYSRLNPHITDDMLSGKNKKESRTRYIFDIIFDSPRYNEDGYPTHSIVSAMPCQIRRATDEEVETCKEYEKAFEKAIDEYHTDQNHIYKETQHKNPLRLINKLVRFVMLFCKDIQK